MALLVSLLGTGTVKAQDGLQILKQAESTLGSLSFSAVYDWDDGTTTMVIQKKGNTGKYLIEREFISSALGSRLTNKFLLNDSGYWHVLPGQALRQDHLGVIEQSAFYGLVARGLDTSSPAEYAVERKRMNGRNLFVVSQRPATPRWGIVENTILIGRDDNLIYEYASKRKDGTVKMILREFKILQDLPDNFFNLPTELKQVICTNARQYAEAAVKAAESEMRSPEFRQTALNYRKRGKPVRYALLGILLLPAIIFGAYYFVKRRTK